jgi:HlyD family secretion protein
VQRMALVALLGGLLAGVFVWRSAHKERDALVYQSVKVDKGDITAYVSATGTVNPLTTVEVGSQVSGILQELYVDFNAPVKKGDPLARLDATLFTAQIKQAEATVKKATGDAQLARKVLEDNTELYGKRLIAQEEYDDSRLKYATTVAALDQARAALEIARANLLSTTIRAPMSGIVVARHVTVGQTIIASTQALFLLASDLGKMQLEANVSEADIGKITVGQGASFTVDAYPNQPFTGTVWQIRNAPVVTQNVVTYSVVLLLKNKDWQLKPGMTADVKILVAQRHNVLRVPRAALRFVPPPGARLDTASHVPNAAFAVWIRQPDGRLRAVPVTTGISDETYTEVCDSTLTEGDMVIVEATEKPATGSQLLSPSILPQPKRF